VATGCNQLLTFPTSVYGMAPLANQLLTFPTSVYGMAPLANQLLTFPTVSVRW
jgi:hypothetical protein